VVGDCSNQVLQISSGVDDSGVVVWQLGLCLLFAWGVVFAVLIKGIGSLGKVRSMTITPTSDSLVLS